MIDTKHILYYRSLKLADIPIGRTTFYEGETLLVVESLTCNGCRFKDPIAEKCNKPNDFAYCSGVLRKDKKNIIFKRIKNNG